MGGTVTVRLGIAMRASVRQMPVWLCVRAAGQYVDGSRVGRPVP